jgi:hypothetical protein
MSEEARKNRLNECLNEVIDGIKLHTESYAINEDYSGKHFDYKYNNQEYRISLMFEESISIFKKNTNNYTSQIIGGRMFKPIINPQNKISDFKEFLDKIELETSFWD